jgi:hypothetical protein
LSLGIDITDIDRGRSGEELAALQEAFEGGGCLMYHFRIGWEEAKLGGLPPERGRENNGRIMAGRILALMAGGGDGGGGTGSGCGATNCSSWFELLMFYESLRSSTIRGNW